MGILRMLRAVSSSQRAQKIRDARKQPPDIFVDLKKESMSFLNTLKRGGKKGKSKWQLFNF